jgi:hypothetical protein
VFAPAPARGASAFAAPAARRAFKAQLTAELSSAAGGTGALPAHYLSAQQPQPQPQLPQVPPPASLPPLAVSSSANALLGPSQAQVQVHPADPGFGFGELMRGDNPYLVHSSSTRSLSPSRSLRSLLKPATAGEDAVGPPRAHQPPAPVHAHALHHGSLHGVHHHGGSHGAGAGRARAAGPPVRGGRGGAGRGGNAAKRGGGSSEGAVSRLTDTMVPSNAVAQDELDREIFALERGTGMFDAILDRETLRRTKR